MELKPQGHWARGLETGSGGWVLSSHREMALKVPTGQQGQPAARLEARAAPPRASPPGKGCPKQTNKTTGGRLDAEKDSPRSPASAPARGPEGQAAPMSGPRLCGPAQSCPEIQIMREEERE